MNKINRWIMIALLMAAMVMVEATGKVTSLSNSMAEAAIIVKASWNKLDIPGNHPYPRDSAFPIYDSQTDRLIIFGGWSGVPYDTLNDTWSLDLTSNT